MPTNGFPLVLFPLESETCHAENQSDIEKQKSLLISAVQEFNKEGKTNGFIYKLKPINRASKYPEQNLAQKYARMPNH